MDKILVILSLGLLLVWLPATGAAEPTPAEQKIEQSKKAIEKHPGRAEPYNALALALARRARETSDPAYYDRAMEAVEQSLRLAPENYAARRTRVWVWLGKHEFAKALAEATVLNKQIPDDLLGYAYLTDAHVELGNYKQAEEAVQWLLDLRPGNIPGLTRAAYLRELFGDVEGAIELMEQAFQRTPPDETEDQAWVLTQLAHLHLAAGRIGHGERLAEEALRVFPDYHYTLAQLARVRQAQGRPDQAVALLRRHYAVAPHPENLYYLAEALQGQGLGPEAQATFAEFAQKARAESVFWDNANRELVFYYADHAGEPERALEVASLEYARRKDVHTLHAYAWALYRNGRLPEAGKVIEQALGVGLRDAKLHYHAGMIAAALGEREARGGTGWNP